MPNQHDDLTKARKYLTVAEQEFEHLTFAADRADTAARIGAGYAHLAAVEQWSTARAEDLELLDAIRRGIQAAAEARPDDEVSHA